MLVSREGAGKDGYKDQKNFSGGTIYSGTCNISCIHWFKVSKIWAMGFGCLHGKGEHIHDYLLDPLGELNHKLSAQTGGSTISTHWVSTYSEIWKDLVHLTVNKNKKIAWRLCGAIQQGSERNCPSERSNEEQIPWSYSLQNLAGNLSNYWAFSIKYF